MKENSNMNNILLKSFGMAFILTLAALGAHAQDDTRSNGIVESAKITTSPEFRTFIEHYVAAINAKNVRSLKESIHSKSVELMDKDSGVSNDCFGIRFKNPSWSAIGANYTVLITPVPADKPLPFAQFVTYPVRPTHLMHLEWHDPINTMKGFQIEEFLVMEGGNWRVVLTTRPSKNLHVQGTAPAGTNTGTIIGKAVDAEAKGVEDVVVSVYSANAAKAIAMADTKPDGSFSIPGVAAGQGYVVKAVKKKSFLGVRGEKPDVTVKGGKTTDLGDIQLKVPSPAKKSK
jgi:hypothetical protein